MLKNNSISIVLITIMININTEQGFLPPREFLLPQSLFLLNSIYLDLIVSISSKIEITLLNKGFQHFDSSK